MLRKGRFDEIFFIDLPDTAARDAIFRVHFDKRKLDWAEFELDRLVEHSAGFSGAEIEQAVVSALYAAHADGVPVQQLRDWAKTRTVSAD